MNFMHPDIFQGQGPQMLSEGDFYTTPQPNPVLEMLRLAAVNATMAQLMQVQTNANLQGQLLVNGQGQPAPLVHPSPRLTQPQATVYSTLKPDGSTFNINAMTAGNASGKAMRARRDHGNASKTRKPKDPVAPQPPLPSGTAPKVKSSQPTTNKDKFAPPPYATVDVKSTNLKADAKVQENREDEKDVKPEAQLDKKPDDKVSPDGKPKSDGVSPTAGGADDDTIYFVQEAGKTVAKSAQGETVPLKLGITMKKVNSNESIVIKDNEGKVLFTVEKKSILSFE